MTRKEGKELGAAELDDVKVGDKGLERLMTEAEAAAYLGLTGRTLQSWRLRGGGPRYHRLSARAIRYRRRDIDHWLDARCVGSTSEY